MHCSWLGSKPFCLTSSPATVKESPGHSYCSANGGWLKDQLLPAQASPLNNLAGLLHVKLPPLHATVGLKAVSWYCFWIGCYLPEDLDPVFGSALGRSFLSDLKGRRRSVGSGGWSHFSILLLSFSTHRTALWLFLFTSGPCLRSCRGYTSWRFSGTLLLGEGSRHRGAMWPNYQDENEFNAHLVCCMCCMG